MEWVDDEAVVLNSETGEVHYLNPPAALAFALIQEHGFEQARARLSEMIKEDSFEEEFEQLVADMLEKGLLTNG